MPHYRVDREFVNHPTLEFMPYAPYQHDRKIGLEEVYKTRIIGSRIDDDQTVYLFGIDQHAVGVFPIRVPDRLDDNSKPVVVAHFGQAVEHLGNKRVHLQVVSVVQYQPQGARPSTRQRSGGSQGHIAQLASSPQHPPPRLLRDVCAARRVVEHKRHRRSRYPGLSRDLPTRGAFAQRHSDSDRHSLLLST